MENSSIPATSSPIPISNSSSSSTKDSITLMNLPIATKLTRTNYLSWQSQIVPLLHGYDLYNFINPMIPIPTPTRTGDNGQIVLNPSYVTWHKQDQILLGWLRASLSEPVLAQVVSCSSSSQLWSALQRSFSATSRARLTELRRNLQNSTKGALNCTDYLQKIQAITDELAFIGFPVSDEDHITHIINGLGAEFNPFIVAITARSEPINLHDLHSLLLTHEQLLQTQYTASAASSGNSSSSAAFYSNAPPKAKNKGYRPSSSQHNNYGPPNSFSRSRPGNFSQPRPYLPGPNSNTSGILPLSNNPSKPATSTNQLKNEICQVCSRKGHTALGCWYRFDTRYGEPDSLLLMVCNLMVHSLPSKLM